LASTTMSAYELNEARTPWGKPQDQQPPNATLARPGEGSSVAPASRERQVPRREGSGAGLQPDTAPNVPDFEIIRIDEAVERLKKLRSQSLTVVQARVRLATDNRARLVDACEGAYHFGKGKVAIWPLTGSPDTPRPTPRAPLWFSNRLHCARCDIEYREPSPALFSFNHPLGACPSCRGFGRLISIDYQRALPDRTKTLAEGVVKPWLTGHGVESQGDLMKFCKIRNAPIDVPFERLPKKWQEWVINGDPDYGRDADHEWPRAWYGVKGYFRWLESKAYKMHVRVLLSRYRSYTPCPDCKGKRFQPEALLYRVRNPEWGMGNAGGGTQNAERGARSAERGMRYPESGMGDESDSARPTLHSELTLADFYQFPIRDALRFIEQIAAKHRPGPSDPIGLVLNEVHSRLGYLVDVGLGYLTLDRPTRTLSGGETERVNLTACLGTRLVNTLYVLDEPSVGLHPRDTGRLIKILAQLRDLGNTVVVVEHEPGVIRAANQIVDLGPGHGESGGEVVFQGEYSEILQSKDSLTGQYLSGRRRIEIPQRRPVIMRTGSGRLTPERDTEAGTGNDNRGLLRPAAASPWLTLRNARLHNLKDITVEIPLNRLVCVTGVSGSGKTTLVREVLLPALEAELKSPISNSKSEENRAERENEDDNNDPIDSPSTTLTGWEPLARAVLVDQSPLGRTPRSNPAVYLGAFDDIRELFAQTDAARRRGLNASAFSFNSSHGQCERCRGAGFEKIEMQFLSDVFIRCPDCGGRRYRPHILEVKLGRQSFKAGRQSSVVSGGRPGQIRAMDKRQLATDESWSIADLLDATVDEVIEFLRAFPDSRPARRAVEKLELLQEVGLGYLRLGQPINTLSGGESQRLKLVSHLAESNVAQVSCLQVAQHPRREAGAGHAQRGKNTARPARKDSGAASPQAGAPALFLFDEPTTGLHYDDVRALLKVFQRLVDAGHSVLVIEHNLEVIKCADWIIDLGPEAGDEGGQLVAQGTPEEIAVCDASHTGRFLRDLAGTRPAASAAPGAEENAEEVSTSHVSSD